jgi:hypothetical protein
VRVSVVTSGLCGDETGAADENDENEVLAAAEHRGERQEELVT